MIPTGLGWPIPSHAKMSAVQRISPLFQRDSRQLIQCSRLLAYPWLDHGFGTRQSAPPPLPVVTLKQIHSDVVVAVSGVEDALAQGDALITSRRGIFLTVRTADCVPILIADSRRRAVAAIHAGWRGTASSIAIKTVRRLREEFDCAPVDLIAAIGPAIGGCCYEVGTDVLERFQPWLDASSLRRPFLDLAGVNRKQLLEAEIPAEHIFCAQACTKCASEDFHSFRRDQADAGRMESMVGIL